MPAVSVAAAEGLEVSQGFTHWITASLTTSRRRQNLLAGLSTGDDDGNVSHATSSSLSLNTSASSTGDEAHSDDSSRTSDQRGSDFDAMSTTMEENIDYAAYEPPERPLAAADLLDSRYMVSVLTRPWT